MTPIQARSSSHGVDWEVQLERGELLPGTTVKGTVAMTAAHGADGRAVIASLVATEHWKFEETTTDMDGHTSRHTVNRSAQLDRLPVQLAAQVSLERGERREYAFEVPVAPLGPATLEANVSRLDWELEVKLDRPGEVDSSILLPVRVLQPTALLRAGVIDVAEFALYEAADSATDVARGTLEIKPMPICVGAPFDGHLTIDTTGQLDLQEVRAEIRVQVQATVTGGLVEELTLWAGRLVGPGPFGGASQVLAFRGDVPATYLPTVELPHGRADAKFHVILARAWNRDPHLVRDVTVCSTTEI